MAAVGYSVSFASSAKLSYPNKRVLICPKFLNLSSFPPSIAPNWGFKARAATPATTATVGEEDPKADDESMSIDNLHRFINLNLGKWTGSFHQFDASGKLLQKVNTKLSVSSYGEDELISLIQTLYIEQPLSNTSISGKEEEREWAEYKIKETNMFTVDKYQQIAFFPVEKAFSLRYQLAGMLEHVLRQGVLGEDDTGEEAPKNLKLPSRRPSIVCENVLYSLEKDRRIRAFHIMDPKGILEMLLVFLEDRSDASIPHPSLATDTDSKGRISPFLGKWKGRSSTKRSGVYGATIAEADTIFSLEINEKGQVIQDITNTNNVRDETTNWHWKGTMLNDLVLFDGGYQMTLLPGGMYMGYPTDIAKVVAETKAFHLELCWLESPGKRQRLIRTYDPQGLIVSSTYFSEVKE